MDNRILSESDSFFYNLYYGLIHMFDVDERIFDDTDEKREDSASDIVASSIPQMVMDNAPNTNSGNT